MAFGETLHAFWQVQNARGSGGWGGEQCTWEVGKEAGLGQAWKGGRKKLELQKAYEQCTCEVGEKRGLGLTWKEGMLTPSA